MIRAVANIVLYTIMSLMCLFVIVFEALHDDRVKSNLSYSEFNLALNLVICLPLAFLFVYLRGVNGMGK